MSGFDCTNFSPECTIVESFYAYIPSLPANAAYAGIFGLSLGLHLVQGIIWRKAWLGFAAAMILGNAGETIGYIGRIMNHNNPFDQTGFLIQICCITIAPAFLSAGIYFCLGTIVRICDPSISRIPPRFFAYIFIPCDFVSLVIQAVGGAMASIATTNKSSPDKGDNIMIAGVSFQVVTLSVFMILSVDYALRLRRSTWAGEDEKEVMRGASEKFVIRVIKVNKKLGLEKWNTINTAAAEKRGVDRKSWTKKESRLFHAFLWALAASTIAIFIRCVYRVIEMSFGWSGVVISNENLFIGFEGVCVSIAVLILNIFHPGFCLKKPGIDDEEIVSDHSIERLVNASGNTPDPSSLNSMVESLRLEKRFNNNKKRRSSLPAAALANSSPNSKVALLYPAGGASSTEDLNLATEEEKAELCRIAVSKKNRMTLTDILRESRVECSELGSSAKDEGWVGQGLRDSIGVGVGRRSLTVTRSRTSCEKLVSKSSTLRSVESAEELLEGQEGGFGGAGGYYTVLQRSPLS